MPINSHSLQFAKEMIFGKQKFDVKQLKMNKFISDVKQLKMSKFIKSIWQLITSTSHTTLGGTVATALFIYHIFSHK